MLVDSHCHLQDPKFDADCRRRASACPRSRRLSPRGRRIRYREQPPRRRAGRLQRRTSTPPSASIPTTRRTLRPRDLDTLSRLADSSRVVAIGEIGLDYYRDLSPREVQQSVFRDQLQLARDLHLPVVIHCRDADDTTFEILAEHQQTARPAWPKDRPLGVMHTFAGDLPLALRYIELGFVISISGVCTYPNAESTRAVARGIPLRWMAVETDAPYLPPQSRRGKRNEPAYLVETVQYIADLRGISFAEVADCTAMTAAGLFGLGDVGEPSRQPVGEAP